MYTNVYLKTSKIDSCTPKLCYHIITIHICTNQTSIYTNSKKI